MQTRSFWRIAGATVLAISALVFGGHAAAPISAQAKPIDSELRPFLGTWTALHAGTPIIVLHLRSDKGDMVGGVQVCSYSINTETTGNIDVVTDPALSKSLPMRNIKVSGGSLSFQWKDPDGDDNHWRLELTGEGAGQIVWLDLPADVKINPIPVTRNLSKPR